ncbi:MAG: PDZ domain-containing protein [Candidatus Aminicenantes bacterium]|nr:PDZ domain-containing protein [Candidatus Aminicenantes bacterium]
MKKTIIVMLLLLLWAAHGALATERIDAIESEIQAVLDRVSPSLVKVVAENTRRYVATGIALESRLIITSSLVTRRPFERLFVETVQGKVIPAGIAGQDPRSGITLLRLEKKGPPPLARAREAAVGKWVALVGLFYDRFPAIFQGIISSASENELILNAPVAPGSAGGAVVNKKGELLGVIRGSVGFSFTPDYTFRDHSASIVIGGSRSESGKLCYAIPVGLVGRIAEKLKSGGKIVPGWLGVTFSGDSNRVLEVLAGSPAADAGMARGDRIEEIAGTPIASFRDIAAALRFRQAGEKVGITVRRSGKALRLDAELGAGSPLEAPAVPAPPAAPEIPDFSQILPPGLSEKLSELTELEGDLPAMRHYVIELGGTPQLGIDVMEITSDLARKFAVSEGYGLLVSRVGEKTVAGKAGMMAGDVIVRANGLPMRRSSGLREILGSLKEKEALAIKVYRDGRQRRITLVPERGAAPSWDIKRFTRKMDSLASTISDEARIIYQDRIKEIKEAQAKEIAETERQHQLSLLKVKQESERLALELQGLQEEKDRLATKTREKYARELRRIAAELQRVREQIRREAGTPPAEKDT